MHEGYQVSSEARSFLEAQQSKWLLIPNLQKCSLSDHSLKLLAKF